jgi:macrolide transport system ATP-binding/permease protein
VRQADPRLPVSEIPTQRALIDGTMNREVVFARLCTGFGLLALAIACIGLYGAMSYNVARRTAGIGIRMALGAQRGWVVWMVLREVLLLAAAGLAISIPAALFATKLVGSFLFETKPNDPVSLAVAAASLVTAAVLAGFLPARNASRIDPMSALRHE